MEVEVEDSMFHKKNNMNQNYTNIKPVQKNEITKNPYLCDDYFCYNFGKCSIYAQNKTMCICLIGFAGKFCERGK